MTRTTYSATITDSTDDTITHVSTHPTLELALLQGVKWSKQATRKQVINLWQDLASNSTERHICELFSIIPLTY